MFHNLRVDVLVVYFVFSIFVPDDIFQKAPIFQYFASSVADVVSTIRPSWNILSHAKSTSFPHAALLCTALAMILIPWLILSASMGILVGYSYARVEKNPFAGMRVPQLLLTALLMFFGIWVGLWIIHIFYVIPGDPGVYAGVTTTSRLGYALLSTGVVLLSAGCIWLQPVYIIFLIDKLFFGGFKNA